jgi:very-short-patch-repair endonuclease
MAGSESPVDLLRVLGGRARTCELLPWTTPRRLAHAVRAGEVVRVRRGVYVLPELPDAHVAAARAGGVLSHTSAAEHWGLGLVALPNAVHVTVPRGARPPAQRGVHLHWATRLEDEQGRVTPVLRTILDCAEWLPFAEALAVADGGVRRGFVRPSELVAAASCGGGRGLQRRVRVATHVDGRPANAFESCLRGIVLDAGLRTFEPQVEIELVRRRVRVDLADPGRRLVLEADSYEHHGSRDALVRDCERYDELVREGWHVLRFSWEHVMFRREWVAETVAWTCRLLPSFVDGPAHGSAARRVADQ